MGVPRTQWAEQGAAEPAVALKPEEMPVLGMVVHRKEGSEVTPEAAQPTPQVLPVLRVRLGRVATAEPAWMRGRCWPAVKVSVSGKFQPAWTG